MRKRLYGYRRGEPRLLAACLLACAGLAAASAQVGGRFALVIGNADYGELGKLKNPANDATDVSAALKRIGFNVELLLNADLPQMEEAAVRLSSKLSSDPGSTGLFYFAGHGVQTQKGENYLIPVHTTIAAEAFLKSRALSAQSVLDLMQDAHNKLNLVFLDACRNNPFSWARSASRGLSVVGNQPPGSIIVYATSAGSVAQDGAGRNGVFTAELLKNMEKPGVDLNTMLDRTAQGVMKATGNQQNPAIYKQFFETAYLAGGGAAQPKQDTLPAPPPAKAPSGEPEFGEVVVTPGALTVSVVTGGSVELAGKRIDIPAGGSLPVRNLKPGSYTLTARYPDGKSESRTIEVLPGQTANLAFSYSPSRQAAGENILFPIYGVTLGKTSVSELARLGKRTSSFDKSAGDYYRCYEIAGFDFWYHNKDYAWNMYLTHTDALPDKWANAGMSWGMSYNAWAELFRRKGCSIEEAVAPHVEDYSGHKAFTAQLLARYAADGVKYKILLDFSYSTGVSRSDPGTLYSIDVKSEEP